MIRETDVPNTQVQQRILNDNLAICWTVTYCIKDFLALHSIDSDKRAIKWLISQNVFCLEFSIKIKAKICECFSYVVSFLAKRFKLKHCQSTNQMFFGNPKHRNISKPIWTLHVLSSRKATSYVILKTTNIIRIETSVLGLVRHWNDAKDRYFRIVFFRCDDSVYCHLPVILIVHWNLIGGWANVQQWARKETIQLYLKSLKSSLLICCASWFVSDIWNFPWKS